MKNFILGCGAQKAGTSWLSKEFESNSHFSNGGCKEWHVFNLCFNPITGGHNFEPNPEFCFTNKRLSAGHIMDSLKKFPELKDAANVFKISMNLQTLARYNPSVYFNFFHLLAYSSPTITHVGDITPAYSFLNHKIFDYIKAELLKKEFRIKTFFILRDPIDRIISAYNMYNALNPSADFNPESLLRFANSKGCRLRTNYPRTINNLKRAFKPSELHIAFYEDIFFGHDDYMNKLSEFLEMPLNRESRVRNSSCKHVSRNDIDSGVINRLRSMYDEIYGKISDLYIEKVPERWMKD